MKLADGRTERISGTPTLNTRRDAERAEREHVQRVLNPKPAQRESISFRTFMEEHWLPTYPKAAGNRATTVREKMQHVRLHLVPHLGDVALDSVRGQVVDRLFAALTEKGLG